MERFIQCNEGLKSRVPYRIDFPDYSAAELTEIFRLMLKQHGFTASDDAMKEALNVFEKARLLDDFGNGRYVRNLIERSVQKQSARLIASNKNIEDIGNKELFLLTKEDICEPQEITAQGSKEPLEEKSSDSARKMLGDMIGLTSAKEIIRKAIASFKVRKLYQEKGIRKDFLSMHMVFTGNPGTAKTTVARLFAEIMKDEKVLPSGKFVEVGRADLVGQYVGHTAPLVKEKFKKAKGGVLFIDEAYSLCDSLEGGYGDEAINTIVQEMENHREDTIVIFAGYPEPMKEFLDRNPGMSSRIAFHVEFEDYSVDELCEITRLMVSKKKMKITDLAMEKLRGIYEDARKSSDYGNGRFVRKMLEEAEMNLAVRVSELPEAEITEELITMIEERDISDAEVCSSIEKVKIGFRVA